MEKKKISGQNYRLLFSEQKIKRQVKKIAAEIKEDYQDAERPIVLILVLRGGMYFGVDLSRSLSEIDCEHEIDTIGLQSYLEEGKNGNIKITSHPQSTLSDRDIIVVEDVLDSGDTMRFLRKYFVAMKKNKQPRSINYCVLLKKQHYNPDLRLSYFAFVAPNDWLVGNGLDSDNLFRGLSGIYQKIEVKSNKNIKKPRIRDRGDSL